jgi:hypothetical protein
MNLNGNHESNPAMASPDTRALRVVLVNREVFVATYVWHLTAFFERVCPRSRIEWACWSCTDLEVPSKMAAASEGVRVANWVIFCQATPSALPAHVQRWAESWPSQEREAKALIGFFSLTGDDEGSEGEAQAFLDQTARKADRGFVAVRDCLWGVKSSALSYGTTLHRTYE